MKRIMTLNDLLFIVLVFVSSSLISCKTRQYAAEDLFGKYQQYAFFNRGLFRFKAYSTYELLADSNVIAKGCNEVRYKWFTANRVLYIVDTTSTKVLRQYKISKNKTFKSKVYKPLVQKPDTTYYLQARRDVFKIMK